jgi:hypothetical protein
MTVSKKSHLRLVSAEHEYDSYIAGSDPYIVSITASAVVKSLDGRKRLRRPFTNSLRRAMILAWLKDH